MKSELKRILTSLVSLETTSSNATATDQAFDLIDQELSWYSFYKHVYVFQGVKSIVWSTVPGNHTEVILNAHLDVVPAPPHLFRLKEQSGHWVGRGVMDMKFAIASFIVALKQVYQDTGSLPSLSLMITSDEELGGTRGVKHLVEDLGYSGNIVLIPDGGSNWHIVDSAKGVLHLEVNCQGKTSHASEPWGGISAIDEMVAKLTKLRTLYKTPSRPTSRTTLVVGKITGGQQTNQVANLASATIDIRYKADESPTKIISQVKQIFGSTNVGIIVQADPFVCDTSSSMVQSWCTLIRPYQAGKVYMCEYGTSDGRYFAAKGMPVIVSQPIGADTHGESEYIQINSVIEYTQVIVNWLKNISSRVK